MICLYQQEGLEYSKLVKKVLKEEYNQAIVSAGKFHIPIASFNPFRNQYDASRLIDFTSNNFDKECDKHLLIVDVDLYTPRYNFIFGLAETQRSAAIVSLYRLAGNGLIQERLKKEVIHEVGHLFGIEHCAVPTCVMYFSNTIEDTDKKNVNLCINCRRKFEKL